jgi:hypothetical protein
VRRSSSERHVLCTLRGVKPVMGSSSPEAGRDCFIAIDDGVARRPLHACSHWPSTCKDVPSDASQFSMSTRCMICIGSTNSTNPFAALQYTKHCLHPKLLVVAASHFLFFGNRVAACATHVTVHGANCILIVSFRNFGLYLFFFWRPMHAVKNWISSLESRIIIPVCAGQFSRNQSRGSGFQSKMSNSLRRYLFSIIIRRKVPTARS